MSDDIDLDLGAQLKRDAAWWRVVGPPGMSPGCLPDERDHTPPQAVAEGVREALDSQPVLWAFPGSPDLGVSIGNRAWVLEATPRFDTRIDESLYARVQRAVQLWWEAETAAGGNNGAMVNNVYGVIFKIFDEHWRAQLTPEQRYQQWSEQFTRALAEYEGEARP